MSLDAIHAALATRDKTVVFTALRGCPIDTMPFMEAIDLLTATLEQAEKDMAPTDVLKVILARWRSVLKATDTKEMIGDIAGMALVPLSALTHIIKKLPGTNIVDVMHMHLNNRALGAGPIFGLMATRLLAASSNEAKLSFQVWNELHMVAEQRQRFDAMPYIEGKLIEAGEQAPYPDWVSCRGIERTLDTKLFGPTAWSEYKAPMSDEKGLTETLKLFDAQVTTVDGEDQAVAPTVLEDVARIAMGLGVGPVDELDDISAAADPDRIFGPLNVILGRECATSITGGCRMLTCCCRDFDQAEDDDELQVSPTSWFEGYCDSCHYTIRDISHAIRQPVVGGGWIGCYCCMECLRNQPARELDQMAELLLMWMVSMLELKGILDRIPPPPPPPQPMREYPTTRLKPTALPLPEDTLRLPLPEEPTVSAPPVEKPTTLPSIPLPPPRPASPPMVVTAPQTTVMELPFEGSEFEQAPFISHHTTPGSPFANY